MDKVFLVLSGIAAAVIGGLLWKVFPIGKAPCVLKEETEEAKENKQDEIKNTPAADLVAADPDAGKLRADAAGIAGKAKQRLRDRIGKIVSRVNGSGNSGGGGS
jgi:hypothetical protein